jgi:hypothetical protein
LAGYAIYGPQNDDLTLVTSAAFVGYSFALPLLQAEITLVNLRLP